MTRKQKYDEEIVELLRNKGPRTFGEIGKAIWGTDWDNRHHPTLNRVLIRLKGDFKIEKIFGKKYALTDNWYESKLRSLLAESVKCNEDKRSQVSKSITIPNARIWSWEVPIFVLGTSKLGEERNGLMEACKARFAQELLSIFDKHEDPDRLGQVIGKLKLACYQKHSGSDTVHKKNNLKQFLDSDKWLGKEPGPDLHTLVWFQLPEAYISMPAYKWILLDNTMHDLVKKPETIAGDHEEILSFLKQPRNSKLINSFLGCVNKIEFTLIASVGNEEIEKTLRSYLLGEFEGWMSRLKSGELDDREWIFNKGMENLAWFRKELLSGRAFASLKALQEEAKGLSPLIPEDPPYAAAHRLVDRGTTGVYLSEKLDIDQQESWDLRYLYEYHSRGKDPNFYKEIYDAAYERRKSFKPAAKRSASMPTGVPTDIFEESLPSPEDACSEGD